MRIHLYCTKSSDAVSFISLEIDSLKVFHFKGCYAAVNRLGKVSAFILVFVICISPLRAELRDSVVVLKPKIIPEALERLEALIEKYDDTYLDVFSEGFKNVLSGGFGSGFFIANQDNQFIVTNLHVVRFAREVDVEILQSDGEIEVLENCPILGVWDDYDLALIGLPASQNGKHQSLEIETGPLEDGSQVWSAGFPGLLGKPAWQLGGGFITDKRSFALKNHSPGLEWALQHSAPIDPGNSGGPLLIRGIDGNYKVIGVNTWSIQGRDNTYFAVPSEYVASLINNFGGSQADISATYSDLAARSKSFAQVMESETILRSTVARYISDHTVIELGEYTALNIRNQMSDSEKADFDQNFYSNAASVMRLSLAQVLVEGFTGGIDSDDEARVSYLEYEEDGEKALVRFTSDEEIIETTWIRETGSWRLSDSQLFNNIRTSSKKRKTEKVKDAENPSKYNLPESDYSYTWGFNGAYLFILPTNSISAHGGSTGAFLDFAWSSSLASVLYAGINFSQISTQMHFYFLMKFRYLFKADPDGGYLRPYFGIGLGYASDLPADNSFLTPILSVGSDFTFNGLESSIHFGIDVQFIFYSFLEALAQDPVYDHDSVHIKPSLYVKFPF